GRGASSFCKIPVKFRCNVASAVKSAAHPGLHRALRLSKKSRPADMCGWTGHIQGNLALGECEAARPSARRSAKFCRQGDTRGKEFLPCAAGRNGFPLERGAFATR